MRNDRPSVAAQMSNRPSQAEKYAEAHCDTLVDWLKNNTVPCACAEKYTRCEKNGACFGLDENKRLLCRRCYVPLGLKKVSLHTLDSLLVSAGPAPPLCVARARHGTPLWQTARGPRPLPHLVKACRRGRCCCLAWLGLG